MGIHTNHRFHTTGQHHLHGTVLQAARLIWAGLILATILMLVIAVPAQIKNVQGVSPEARILQESLGIPAIVIAIYSLALSLLSILVFLGVALILFFRRSNDWMVMLTSITLAMFGGLVVNSSVYHLSLDTSLLSFIVRFLQGLGGSFFVLFLYLFPSGRFAPRWTSIFAISGVIWFMAVGLVGDLFFADGLPGWLYAVVSFIFYGTSALTSLIPQWAEQKFAHPTQEQQAKWVFTGLIIALIGFATWSFPPVIFPALRGETVEAAFFMLFGSSIVSLALLMLPVTIAFSIMRYRLWDVDFILNRGIVYGGLTFILILFTLIDMFVLQRVLQLITGSEQSTYALVIAALISGAAFNPIRKMVINFVDRQIYGIKVDYDKKPVMTPAARDYSDSTIGPYHVTGLIGRGGMAEVYKAIHPTLNRPVAVKMMLADRANREEFQKRFEREAQTVAQLRHPNIIEIFDFGEHEGANFMVMEYIDGPDLNDYIDRREQLSLEETVGLLRDIASALDYAHENGLVHRDIKPSNIMLRQDTTASGTLPRYHAVLMDFGIAKIRGGHTGLTRTGMVGTLDYIAPEQIRDAKDVDGRADVYALGIVAFEMITGKRPFVGSNAGAILIAHLQQPPPDPRHLVPELPDHAADAIIKAMAKDPGERFTSAGACVDAIQGG